MIKIFICYKFSFEQAKVRIVKKFFWGEGAVIPVNVCNEFQVFCIYGISFL